MLLVVFSSFLSSVRLCDKFGRLAFALLFVRREILNSHYSCRDLKLYHYCIVSCVGNPSNLTRLSGYKNVFYSLIWQRVVNN